MSNSIVLVLEITYRLYAKWNESGSQNKVSCLYLNRVAKSTVFILNRVRMWRPGRHSSTQNTLECLPRGGPAAGHIQLAIWQQITDKCCSFRTFCSQSWNLLNGIEAKNVFYITLFNICWTRAATFVDQRITGACIWSGIEFCGVKFCHFCGYFYDPQYVNKYYQPEKLVFSCFKTSLRLF